MYSSLVAYNNVKSLVLLQIIILMQCVKMDLKNRHPFQTRRETVNCQRPRPRSSMQWTMKYLEDNWLSGVNRCLFSPRYLPFWSCRAWRLAKHNLSGLLNSMTWRKKTPVASQLRPLWSEKSSWQALNCCNAVWPTVIPNQFRSWLRTFSCLIF